MPPPIVETLTSLGDAPRPIEVTLSNELVGLLSNQMYQSPLKAIEELVVNAYDADADECRVSVPDARTEEQFVAVYDDGIGMDYEGLRNLWQIGRSNKRTEEIAKLMKRKQIGKFGIGKLASYTLARHVTYVTRTGRKVLFVTMDFDRFQPHAEGLAEPITLSVHRVSNLRQLGDQPQFRVVLDALGLEARALFSLKHDDSWTLCVLESLKETAAEVSVGRLRWVLATAMPLRADFALYLNRDAVVSSKETIPRMVQFPVGELGPQRLAKLAEPNDTSAGTKWRVVKDHLVAERFPSGVRGLVDGTPAELASVVATEGGQR